MNIALWIVQGILAAMFLMAGLMKLTQPKDKIREKVGDWVDGFSASSIKLIGLLEFLGAIGLILPMALNIMPLLTPVAAIGLVLTMVGAMIVHLQRKENDKVPMNIILLALALFVVVGRLILVPVI